MGFFLTRINLLFILIRKIKEATTPMRNRRHDVVINVGITLPSTMNIGIRPNYEIRADRAIHNHDDCHSERTSKRIDRDSKKIFVRLPASLIQKIQKIVK